MDNSCVKTKLRSAHWYLLDTSRLNFFGTGRTSHAKDNEAVVGAVYFDSEPWLAEKSSSPDSFRCRWSLFARVSVCGLHSLSLRS